MSDLSSTGGHGHSTGATNSGVTMGPDYDATTDPSGTIDTHLPHGTEATAERARVPVPAGVVAEFTTPQAMLDAATTLREAGYRKFDTYSPYPVHGSDEAVGIRPTILPWIVLGAAAFGAANALGMIWYLNKIDYPFQISGKPLFALPPAMPITFELTVLFSAITAFLCVIVLSNLPRFNNPLLRAKSFARGTDDRFVVAVDARDDHYGGETESLLSRFSPVSIETVMEDDSNKALPMPVLFAISGVAVMALFPLAWAGVRRNSTTEEPRIHPIQDMDFQPRYNAQQAISPTLNPDGKAAFAPVANTRRYRSGTEDVAYTRGIVPEEDGTLPPPPTGQNEDGSAKEYEWVTAFPLEVDQSLMERGQERYRIYCTPCHGLGGDGDGLVTQRALALEQGTWVQPVSFHTAAVREQPAGRLYNTITNGIRKMPGYADQIPVEDRWAIVLYLRALQRSRVATEADVDPGDLAGLRSVQ